MIRCKSSRSRWKRVHLLQIERTTVVTSTPNASYIRKVKKQNTFQIINSDWSHLKLTESHPQQQQTATPNGLLQYPLQQVLSLVQVAPLARHTGSQTAYTSGTYIWQYLLQQTTLLSRQEPPFATQRGWRPEVEVVVVGLVVVGDWDKSALILFEDRLVFHTLTEELLVLPAIINMSNNKSTPEQLVLRKACCFI